MESELVTADMVDASEYPELSDAFQVYGVPLTVVNNVGRVEGGMPEQMFVPHVLNSANAAPPKPKILIAR
ncbi:MAG: thioredoxin family protein [Chloroflexi bacterium]|nr:thioredoxin family protein [Chloroflexota bacterium]